MKPMKYNGDTTKYLINENGDICSPKNHLLIYQVVYHKARVRIRFSENKKDIKDLRVDRLVYENFLDGRYDDEFPLFYIDGDINNCAAKNIHVGFIPDNKHPNEIWKRYEYYQPSYDKGINPLILTNYWVSTYGRVYNARNDSFPIPLHGSHLISVDGIQDWINIERMLAESFVPNPYCRPYAVVLNPDTFIHATNVGWSYDRYDFNPSFISLDEDLQVLYGESFEFKNQEMWKPIFVEGLETVYMISRLGKIFNRKRSSLLTHHVHGAGYVTATLTTLPNNLPQTNILIHRAVAEAFIPNPHNLPVVNHKNRNRRDFSISNLEWTTYSENNLHAQNLSNRKKRVIRYV